jgi:hypothetical protein
MCVSDAHAPGRTVVMSYDGNLRLDVSHRAKSKKSPVVVDARQPPGLLGAEGSQLTVSVCGACGTAREESRVFDGPASVTLGTFSMHSPHGRARRGHHGQVLRLVE